MPGTDRRQHASSHFHPFIHPLSLPVPLREGRTWLAHPLLWEEELSRGLSTPAPQQHERCDPPQRTPTPAYRPVFERGQQKPAWNRPLQQKALEQTFLPPPSRCIATLYFTVFSLCVVCCEKHDNKKQDHATDTPRQRKWAGRARDDFASVWGLGRKLHVSERDRRGRTMLQGQCKVINRMQSEGWGLHVRGEDSSIKLGIEREGATKLAEHGQ